MTSHDELVAEMPILEQMGTQERQKLAKKRRMQQLKKWSQREKEWLVKEKQLNKRLANTLSEENNGLNLKQYTTYNSNQRNKKKSISAKNGSNTNGNDDSTKQQKLTNNNYNLKNNNATNGAYPNSLAPNGRVHFNVGVMLLEAAARNDYDEVKRLLSLGVSPDSINHDGLTALHQCCIDASEPIMNLLLEYGANVDARDTEQWTPLHAACTCGHLNLVKILVEHGADLLAVNGDGNMPFDICEDEATLDYIETQMVARGITQEMIDLTRASSEMQMLSDLERLIADKSDLNVADIHGVTQLHIAAANNYLSAVKLLLKHGVNVNVCDNDHWTPLHGVACWGNETHIKVVELLVEAGASLDVKTSNDETVFDLCDNIDLLERLNQLKDELDSKQASGAGRLKRTQSKTNSRVHSVRRTSVRDKNQISRREAREEALLRVESNEALNNSGQKESLLKESGDSSSSNETSSNQAQTDQRETTDQVDRSEPLETDLDGYICQDQSKKPTQGLISNGESQIHPPQNGHLALSNERSQNETQKCEPGANDDQPANNTGNLDSIEPSSRPDNSNRMRIHSAPQLVNGNQIKSSINSVNDLNGRLPAQSTTVVQVHFAPMNYTLSNLKKHRSDLRMRSASSGSALPNSTTVVQLTGDHDQISAIPNGDALDGMESINSPTSMTNGALAMNGHRDMATFRKFHGQPSEVIEFTENSRRRKCCVII